MREAIGGSWLFGLVITFIVFFASFLAVSINYSKAFNVKNNIVDLISKYEGNNQNSRAKIASYLNSTGYLVTGTCPDDEIYNGMPIEYKAYNLQGDEMTNTNRGYYCIAEESTETTSATIQKKYYRVVVFFKIDLPMMGDLATFRIRGETETIYYPVDN